MRKVYTNEQLAIVHIAKDLLENQGIECIIKNAHMAGGVGHLPAFEVWPELWILSDEQFEQANSILKEQFG